MQSKDVHGHSTLDKLSKASHFNNWIYKSIKPWIHGNVIEFGSGIGNISSLIVKDGHSLLITETDEAYVEILHTKFQNITAVQQILALDLVDPDFDQKYHQLFYSFDTAIAINVIEHIDDDFTAFRNAGKFLKKHGKLIVLVPHGGYLYNKLDHNLSHFRRYDQKRIRKIFQYCGLQETKLFYFNTIGVAGWLFTGSIMKQKTIPNFMVNLFELILPLTSWLDVIFKRWFGLSIIAIGKAGGAEKL